MLLLLCLFALRPHPAPAQGATGDMDKLSFEALTASPGGGGYDAPVRRSHARSGRRVREGVHHGHRGHRRVGRHHGRRHR